MLYEPVRPTNPRLAELLSPLTRRLFGPEMNRRTEQNLARAGLIVDEITRSLS
ncbi:hypothetical protein [Actinomycetospora lemnae]|uniref:Uncharacterized protein n=1 Tax=Actinomycetospora lemnae TaxID=3019891 RepID=A0ABT5STG6_9PSEU|nr:hypothetical protein [Actinomycetospora sp. DW7H6]MDD7966142.1 hypothetical protein [Actinomycetospora sp. DW7H6]